MNQYEKNMKQVLQTTKEICFVKENERIGGLKSIIMQHSPQLKELINMESSNSIIIKIEDPTITTQNIKDAMLLIHNIKVNINYTNIIGLYKFGKLFNFR